MFPTDSAGSVGPGDHVQKPQPSRPLNPRSSIEDYNRVMLEYTRRRMSTFVDISGPRHNSPGSANSDSSGKAGSGTSSTGMLARQAQGARSVSPASYDDGKRGRRGKSA